MSSRYDIGPYGVNNYSAYTTLEDDVLAAANFAQGAVASAAKGANSLVDAFFDLAASGNYYMGGAGLVTGTFSLYAEPKFSIQQLGEALVTGQFSFSVSASVQIDSARVETLTRAFYINLDPFEGKFWNPENTVGWWVPEQPAVGIWTKQTGPVSPWRN